MPRHHDAPATGEPIELLPAAAVGAQPGASSSARIRVLWYPRRLASLSWSNDLVAEYDTVVDAIAMPLTDKGQPKSRISGAVYTAQGELVRHSERGKTNRVWRGNLSRLRVPTSGVERLEGRTFFAGFHRNIFGHILLELLPRFWPDLDYSEFDTFLCYPQRSGHTGTELSLKPYARDLLVAASGNPLPPLRMVAAEPLQIAELTVPSPAFWLQRGFSPAVKQVFDRVADNLTRDAGAAADDAPRRIYLSRSRLTGLERRAMNEAEIESLVESAGFTVVHPQELPVREQVALMRGAEAIAGCDGSALHLAAFARPGTRLVAFDSRSVPNQFLVDHLGGIDAVHVMAGAERVPHQRTELWQAELHKVKAGLDLAGLM